MKKKIIYKNFIQKKYLNLKLEKKFNKYYSHIIKDINFNLDTSKNTFHSLSKKFKLNFKINDLSRFKRFQTVVIIGMGGSILGSEAIYHFFRDKIKKNFLFFDNINEDMTQKLKNKKNLNKILFIIVSKSGKTIETLSNILALKIIKKSSKNIILISEKNDNPLYLLSQKMKLFFIAHKKYIGGRYSVLSEVGLVPAYLMGINILKLRENLIKHLKKNNKKFLKESSIKLSTLLKKNRFKNIIFFNYVPKLDKFLYWNQQLISESLGKNGKGFLPLVSTMPKDYHSLLQLFLDGPRDKFFYIFSSNMKVKRKINSKILGKKMNFLNNKSLSEIKTAQKNALVKVLKKNQIPYREFIINDYSEQTLGELFSYFILEIAIIGKLSKINPFNQPAVEQIKINTKKILI